MNLVQPSVRIKLRRLQSAIKARLAGEGFAWVIVALITLVFFSLALDFYLRLDLLARIVISLLGLAAAIFVAGKYIAVPLMVPLDNDNLALLVERRYGQLKDRLISAIQFSRAEFDTTFASQAMVNHMACEANDIAEKINFKDVIERKTLLHATGVSGFCLAVLALFTVLAPDTMSIWAKRNLCFQNVPWPQRTYLSVPVRVASLKPCIPAVSGAGVNGAYYYYRSTFNGSRVFVGPFDGAFVEKDKERKYDTDKFALVSDPLGNSKFMPAPVEAGGKAIFTHAETLDGIYTGVQGQAGPGGVPRVVSDYKVLRGDRLTVEILADLNEGHEAPSDLCVHVKYPSMSDIATFTLKRGEVRQGGIKSGLNGKWMSYSVELPPVNEDLRFWVTGGDDETDAINPHRVLVADAPSVKEASFRVNYPEYVNFSGDNRSRAAKGMLAARVGSNIEVTLTANKDIRQAQMYYSPKDSPNAEEVARLPKQELLIDPANPRKLVGRFEVGLENKAAVGQMGVILWDIEGYKNNRPQVYQVQVQPDLPPVADLKTRGIGNRISARASIPTVVAIKDDIGIATVTITVTVTPKEAASQPASAPASAPAKPRTQLKPLIVKVPWPGGAGGSAPREYKDVLALVKTIDFRTDATDVTSGLRPGDKVVVTMNVADNLPGTYYWIDDATKAKVFGPNKVESASIGFEVVSDSDLLEEFLGRLSAIHVDLLQLINNQVDASTKMAQAAADAASVSAAAQKKQHYLEAKHGQIGVSADSAKIYSSLEGVIDEMSNNDIGKPEDRAFFRSKLDALKNVQGMIAKVVTAVTDLEQEAQNDAFRRKAQGIQEDQRAIIAELEKIAGDIKTEGDRQRFALQLQLMIQNVQQIKGWLENTMGSELNELPTKP